MFAGVSVHVVLHEIRVMRLKQELLRLHDSDPQLCPNLVSPNRQCTDQGIKKEYQEHLPPVPRVGVSTEGDLTVLTRLHKAF
jgi:hypothetical protein